MISIFVFTSDGSKGILFLHNYDVIYKAGQMMIWKILCIFLMES